MKGKTYGYARVSTAEQHEDRQVIALREAGVAMKDIYIDKISGKDFNRPKYRALVKKLNPGDTVYSKSIDRLGRKYSDIIEEWRTLTKERGIDIVVLDMRSLLDTRKYKDLLGTFLSDVVLALLSFVAENERAAIRQRQREGIEAAKRRGKHLGRPRRALPPCFEECCRRWLSREISGTEAAKKCRLPYSTFYRKAKEAKRKAASTRKE